ncbi:hypothetical protein IWW55_005831 [Coemansia sp. RSA 2706]|nr:hypothetical protein LPJ63_003256 [Coemansia sp. RSA 2711]KAJ1847561.1 hypothetical protein LPJ70_001468 [Coemansia sp. RSA 2708]KAJ2292468.1 hypothetical protein IWW55_005831 [Coemansia sp. RSA 2706]KAJ2307861.1 hypothetical protein IWW52_005979 [Coemansia sp. RSA 2704]KAJ2317963.1 hypothetical protein IWW51_005229 [Coemansia sp. RSA 2702]KAJ2364015.1 hypothetical protein H4S01_003999 [Coemansia sp. RSA 2610]KAJ2390367.1 hypothetical protein H4S02_001899 [Coemansia sp. RSA 2611]KAJ271373
MLRSKNLKRVLEQALTRDISVCAVFNADGVVLAHASKAGSPQASSLATEAGSPGKRPGTHSRSGDDGDGSSLGSFDLGDALAGIGPREKLDDDLAIAASLWQSYESLPALIERKDRDADDYDGASELDDAPGNSLHLAVVECAHGKASVARLGRYRLFLLSRASTPLGMLKLKSDSLCRYLEDCLQIYAH